MRGALLLVLVAMGIAGTMYKLIGPGGWIADAFNRASDGVVLVAALIAGGFFAWLFRGYSARERSHASAFVYAFAAAGLVYLARYWISRTI